MFVAVIFPIADFRTLHRDNAGRLNRPAWGNADPQARFARGFGSIHTRTKSGNGFSGENYYADCDNIVRYPEQIFLEPLSGADRSVLLYPFYRRFYFDGQMSGRFELGFRLNAASIEDIFLRTPRARYSPSRIASQLLRKELRIDLLDGRTILQPIFKSMIGLRDGWLLSSTKTEALKEFSIEEVGSNYVGVGSPFVFVRAGRETKIVKEPQKRTLIDTDQMELFLTRSGIHGQDFDVSVIPSEFPLDGESAKERVARLFYTQARTIAFAQSFYMRQILSRKISGPSAIESSVKALLDRLSNLNPLADSEIDSFTCKEMSRVLQNADIDVKRMAQEISETIRPHWFWRTLSPIFNYFDKKADKAIEAAAATATKQLLSGSP